MHEGVNAIKVRAKFTVWSITDSDFDDQGGKEIVLQAVTYGSKENEEFFKYTPSGGITLSIVNPKAAEQFHVGDDFYVDFIKA